MVVTIIHICGSQMRTMVTLRLSMLMLDESLWELEDWRTIRNARDTENIMRIPVLDKDSLDDFSVSILRYLDKLHDHQERLYCYPDPKKSGTSKPFFFKSLSERRRFTTFNLILQGSSREWWTTQMFLYKNGRKPYVIAVFKRTWLTFYHQRTMVVHGIYSNYFKMQWQLQLHWGNQEKW